MENPFLYYYLPYCLHPAGEGGTVVLNRLYKPLGWVSRQWVDYEQHAVKLQLSTAVRAQLAWGETTPGPGETIYLYTDSDHPSRSEEAMAAYLERLRVLSRVLVKKKT